jgi:peptide/nickel transport system substrate-binding protein
MDNDTGFGTPESDKLIEKINSTLDKKQRDVLCHEFQKIVSDNCPSIPMISPTDRVMISKRYPNATTNKIRPFYQEHTFKK